MRRYREIIEVLRAWTIDLPMLLLEQTPRDEAAGRR